MDSVKFSKNHNKKLLCDAFTTIRKPSAKYQTGEHYEIMVGECLVKEARLVDIQHGLTETLSEMQCFIDTGMNKAATLKHLAAVYGALPAEVYLLTFITTKNYAAPLFRMQLMRKCEIWLEAKRQMTLGMGIQSLKPEYRIAI